MRYNEIFTYEPLTGTLIWKERPASDFPSKRGYSNYMRQFCNRPIRGGNRTDGYLSVCILGKFNLAHRIIWEMHFGAIPYGMEIDHINGVPSDNRISNLRLVVKSQNQWNMKIRSDNRSGCKGVAFHNRNEKWIARISHNGIEEHIGSFNTKEDAIAARKAAEQQHHGKYARP